MKALIFEEKGIPVEVVKLVELADPKPAPGQALVRIRLATIHPSDVNILRGVGGTVLDLPASPGQEAVGTVEALGENTGGPAIGSRVVVFGIWGAWRGSLICNVENLMAVPDEVGDGLAAQLFITPTTAYILTILELKAQKREWLLQSAAASSVGKMVIQLGKVFGFKTLNVVYKRSQVKTVEDLGGDAVICTEDQNLAEEIARITDGKGVSKAIDCVAGQTGADIFRCLTPNGKMIVYGALSSHGKSDKTAYELPLYAPRMIYTGTIVQGWWLNNWMANHDLKETHEAIHVLWPLFESGQLSLQRPTAFAPENFKAALDWVGNGDGGKAQFKF
jgi:NADPH:quinone reductase-like Zn-dependent oxidoreductase